MGILQLQLEEKGCEKGEGEGSLAAMPAVPGHRRLSRGDPIGQSANPHHSACTNGQR